MKKTIKKHYEIKEPIHEYFVTICKWCDKEMPETLDVWWGNDPKPGDLCPFCGRPLVEEIDDGIG